MKVAYNNEEDRTVKEFTHKFSDVGFVSISDVEASFATLKTRTPVSRNVRTHCVLRCNLCERSSI